MKKLFASLVCALATAGAFALNPSDYTRSFSVTLSPAHLPASGELTDFPALLRLSTDIPDFSYDDFKQANGGDLAIVDEDGTCLAYEIDTWNTSGESLVWVKIPRLTKWTKLTVYYGSDISSSVAPSAVWSDYAAVWHCSEESDNLSDSSGNNNSAVPTKKDGNISKMIAHEGGAVGKSRYNQDNCTYYSGRDYIGGHVVPIGWESQFSGGTAWTASGWFKAQQIVSWERLFSCKSEAGGTTGWRAEMDDSSRKIFFGTQGSNGFRAECPNIAGSEWVNITFVMDGTHAACYTNGYLSASSDSIPSVQWPAEGGFGLGGNPTCTEAGFFGWIDELRLKPSALAADEIAATYETVADRTFFTYSPVREVNPIDFSAFAKSITFTIGEAAPRVDTNQVVLVRLSSSISGFAYEDFTDQVSGSDMLFTDADGYPLEHEIDTWNASGESLVWVRLPSCRPGDIFRLYYGQQGYESTTSSSTWKDYVGVWHFREESGIAYDSTANRYDGTPSGTGVAHNIGFEDGVVGMARDNGGQCVNNDNDKVGMSLTSTTSLELGTKFTVSGFFYIKGGGGWYRLVSRRAGSSGGWGQELRWDDITTLNVYGASDGMAVKIPFVAKEWLYLTLCYDNKTCTVYANGEFLTTATLARAPADNGNVIFFGNDATGNEWSLHGCYDEIRLMRGTPSAETIAADYATMTRSDFLSASPAQAAEAKPIDCSQPVITRTQEGKFEGSFMLFSGSGSFTASYDGDRTQTLSDITSEKGEKAFAVDSLNDNEAYRCTLVGTSASGATYSFVSHAFYTGALTVQKIVDADELHTRAGVFRISRADTEAATRHALTVNYAFSGTAIAGINYAGAATGTVEIPVGAAFVDVEIEPLVDAATDGDKTLVLALTDGAYLAGEADAAEMTIRKLPPPTKHNFKRCLALTIPANFLGEDEVLRDFPVLVRLSTAISGFNYADFKTDDGSDMVFVDSSFVSMPHSIDEWHADGESLVWVCVPELRRNTRIKLYYGSEDDIAGARTDRPWKGYVGVWHFNENAPAVPARDFSGNGLDAVPGATHYVFYSDNYEDGGKIGLARWNQPTIYGNGGKNWYEVPNYDDKAVGDTFLFSGWFRSGSSAKTPDSTGWQRLVSRKSSVNGMGGWEVSLPNSFTTVNVRGSASSDLEAQIPSVANCWVHLAFQYTRNSGRTNYLSVYANGELVGENEVGLGSDNGLPLAFGCQADHDEPSFYGAFDELRLRRGNDGAVWVKAEYLTASDPAFVAYGAVEPAVGGFILIIR